MLNSSTFFGREGTSRYFHNFYGVFDLMDQVTIMAAFDIGWQQQLNANGERDGYKTWYNPNLIVRLKPTEKFSIAGRLEYYHDPNNLVIAVTELGDGNTVMSFQTFSPSMNLDYFPLPSVALRLEGKLYASKNAVFIRKDEATKTSGLVATSLAFKF